MSNATLLKGYMKHFGSERERKRERDRDSTALVMQHPFVKNIGALLVWRLWSLLHIRIV